MATSVMTTATNLQPDVTLLLDAEGVIREATFASSLATENAKSWLGRPWTDTVASLGNSNVQRILDDAKSTGISAFRQVTQRFPSGLEVPMEYTTVLLGGRAGMLAIGKNLQAVAELQSSLIAAQQAMERDHWKLREVETRYRLLFDASSEAVLIVKASNLRVVEANPAALQALELPHRSRDAVAGQELLSMLSPQDRGTAPGHADAGSRSRQSARYHRSHWPGAAVVDGSRNTRNIGAVALIRHSTGTGRRCTAGRQRSETPSVEELIEQIPDCFVVLNQEGVILSDQSGLSRSD